MLTRRDFFFSLVAVGVAAKLPLPVGMSDNTLEMMAPNAAEFIIKGLKVGDIVNVFNENKELEPWKVITKQSDMQFSVARHWS